MNFKQRGSYAGLQQAGQGLNQLNALKAYIHIITFHGKFGSRAGKALVGSLKRNLLAEMCE